MTLPIVLVPVIVKKCRLNTGSVHNFHTHKCFGGVLNPNAQHGRGYYVRRLFGQSVPAMTADLQNVKMKLEQDDGNTAQAR
jgi:hypothetical protein